MSKSKPWWKRKSASNFNGILGAMFMEEMYAPTRYEAEQLREAKKFEVVIAPDSDKNNKFKDKINISL